MNRKFIDKRIDRLRIIEVLCDHNKASRFISDYGNVFFLYYIMAMHISVSKNIYFSKCCRLVVNLPPNLLISQLH